MVFDLKDYEPVEDRLREFWSDHPKGRIATELVHAEDGDYIVKALVYLETYAYETSAAATGYAHDSAAELPANMKASALEVCETSAIGRALANLGYAAKGKRPSREEMSKTSPAMSEPAAEQGVASKGGAGGSLAPAGDTSSATSGGVVADAKAGEMTTAAAVPKDAERSPVFPLDPTECSHKFPSGRWVTWKEYDGDWVCPKCGTPRLLAMETTTADLGPA